MKATDPSPPSGRSVIEYRVVREDGIAVPMLNHCATGDDGLRGAEYTLHNRRQRGARGPYRIETRTITYSEWEATDA